MNKEITKSVIVLTLIAVICTALLVVGNKFLVPPKTEGITAEVLEKLEKTTGSTQFVELDFSGINVHETVTNVYKATDGENKDAIIYRIKQNRLSRNGPVAGQTVELFIAVKDGAILGIDNFPPEGGMYDTPFKPAVYALFKDVTKDNVPQVADLKAQTNLISNATESTNGLIAAAQNALNDYAQNKDALLAAPEKTQKPKGPATIALEKNTYDVSKKEGDVRYSIKSSDSKKFNLETSALAGEYKVEVTAATEDGNAQQITVTVQPLPGEIRVFLKLKNAEMGKYKITFTIKDKNDKQVDSQTVELELIDPVYSDIAKWLNVSTSDISKVYDTDPDAEDDITVAVYNAQGFDIAYGFKSINSNSYSSVTHDHFETSIKVYIKIDADGIIQGVKVINLDYTGYNNVDGDSLNNTDTAGSGPFEVEDLESGATVTRIVSNEIVQAIIEMYQIYKAA